jgi:hypothetical protein
VPRGHEAQLAGDRERVQHRGVARHGGIELRAPGKALREAGDRQERQQRVRVAGFQALRKVAVLTQRAGARARKVAPASIARIV